MNHNITTDGNSSFQRFASITEALDVLQHRADRGAGAGADAKPESEKTSVHFFGPDSWAKGFSLARGGWPEGLARIQAARAGIQIPIGRGGDQIAPIFAEEGEEVAVDRFLDGESDHWIGFPITETPRGRIARIRTNVSVSASFSPEQIMERGAFVAALVDAMESAGIRCEVVLCAAVEAHNGKRHHLEVGIKRAEDPVELDRLAFWLVHPAVSRRLWFRSIEQGPFFASMASDYGMPSEWSTGSEDEIYIPKLLSARGEEEVKKKAIDAVLQWIDVDKN